MSALDALAEAYVLGLLEPREAAEVEARLDDPREEADRALAGAVGALRDRLLPLDLTAPDLPLRPGAWERLEAALIAPAARARRDDAPPAGRAPPAPAPPTARGWRLAALGSMAAALLLAVALAWQTFTTRTPAVLVVLLDDLARPVAVLEAYADNSVLVTPLVGVDPGPAQVLQLWTLPDPEGSPVSVGLLEAATQLLVQGPDLPAPVEGQLYEITIEAAGGSPTGLPTGPIIGLGNAQTPVLD